MNRNRAKHNLINRLGNLTGRVRHDQLDDRELTYLSALLDHFHQTRNEWRQL